MANLEGMEKKFFVLKNEDIKQHLTLEQKVQLHDIERTIDGGRTDEGKQPAS